MKRRTYKKNKTGAGGSKGTDYQIKLLEFFLLQGYHNKNFFELSTEYPNVGSFDDVVFESPETTILLQAKHRSKTITYSNLFPESSDEKNKSEDHFNLFKYVNEFLTNVKQYLFPESADEKNKSDGHFNLLKYVKEFPNIARKNQSINYLIICTDSKYNIRDINNQLNLQINKDDNIYHLYLNIHKNIDVISSINNTKCYSFEESFFGDIVECIFKNLTISEDDIKLFLKKLTLVSIFTEDLDNQINQLIKTMDTFDNTIHLKFACNFLFHKIKTWMQSEKGICLTNETALEYTCIMRSGNYVNRIIQKFLNVEFQKSLIDKKLTKNLVLKIRNKSTYDIHLFKLYQLLLNNIQNDKGVEVEEKILIINPQDHINIIEVMIGTFKMPEYIYLVIPIFNSEMFTKLQKILNEIIDLTEKKSYKKIIFVFDISNDNTQFQSTQFLQDDAFIKFSDFSSNTREIILNGQLNFQGNQMSVKQLLLNDDPHRLIDEIVDEVTIFKIFTNTQEIVINKMYNKSDKDVTDHIKRIFVENPGEVSDEFLNKDFGITPDLTTFSEDLFCSEVLKESDNKFIVLFDKPGMGKSFILNRLCDLLRFKPYWIIKINLNEYAHILLDLYKKHRNFISLEEFLNLLSYSPDTDFAKNIFNLPKKVVFLLDALDEICPEYTDLVLNTLSLIKNNSNIRKIVITSRPHVSLHVSKKLDCQKYYLVPFSEEESVSFLYNYFTKTLQKQNDEGACNKIKIYIKELLNRFAKTFRNWNKFIGIPLQIKMIGDIFVNASPNRNEWLGCPDFLSSSSEIKFPENMNISTLYDMFVESKKNIYIDEKCNVRGNAEAIEALTNSFEASINVYIAYALKIVFGENFKTNKVPTNSELKKLLKIGILTESNNDIQFIHRTFAEYFVAKHICDLLTKDGISNELLKFLIHETFNNIHSTVNIFIDFMLENKIVLDGVLNQFCDWIEEKNSVVSIGRNIFNLAIQIVPKCGGYESFYKWKNESFLTSIHNGAGDDPSKKFINILNKVQNINVRDKARNTPLHLACVWNSKDVVKFLLDKGHKVNVRKRNGETPLHLAAYYNSVETVELLLKRGHLSDVRTNYGETPLDIAVSKNSKEVVQLLLPKNPSIMASDNYANKILGNAINYNSNSKEILELLLNNGCNVNATSNKGESLLHEALRIENEEIVKLLLDKGHSVNYTSNSGLTPLHVASRTSQKFVELLLEKKPIINVVANDGTTPLHNAVRSGKEVVNLLLQNGHIINVSDDIGRTPLHLATSTNKIEIAEFLLDKGHLINVSTNYGTTPLHDAVRYCSKEFVELFLDRGHIVNVKENDGNTPLHDAVCHKEKEVAQLLLNKGHLVNVEKNDGTKPLHCASQSGSNENVQLLLDKGHTVNVRDQNGAMPLHNAAGNISKQIAELLISKGHYVNTKKVDGTTPLHIASQNVSQEIVELLLDAGHPIDVSDNDGTTPLHNAAGNISSEISSLFIKEKYFLIDITRDYGHLPAPFIPKFDNFGIMLEKKKIVKLLLDKGHLVNVSKKDGTTPLHIAIENESLEISELLIDRGQFINVCSVGGTTPLHIATYKGSKEIVELLLRKGHEVNVSEDDGTTPLHNASRYESTEIAKLLLDREHCIVSTKTDGQTPLHIAAIHGNRKVAQLLLQKGHLVNVTTSNGTTALHCAIESGWKKLAELLLDNGHLINVSKNDGMTPLHIAANSFSTAIAEMLLQKGHLVNVSKNDGITPLHIAVENDWPEMVELLLNSGHTVSMRNINGVTPLELAQKEGFEEVTKLLIDKAEGAKN